MFNTGQAIEKLLNGKMGLTLIMIDDPNIHIFKCIDGTIAIGEYGNGAIEMFEYWKEPYVTCKWRVDFEGSNLAR